MMERFIHVSVMQYSSDTSLSTMDRESRRWSIRQPQEVLPNVHPVNSFSLGLRFLLLLLCH